MLQKRELSLFLCIYKYIYNVISHRFYLRSPCDVSIIGLQKIIVTMIDCATKSVDIKPLPWEAQSSFCLSLSTQSSDHNTWTVWVLLGMLKNFRFIVWATEKISLQGLDFYVWHAPIMLVQFIHFTPKLSRRFKWFVLRFGAKNGWMRGFNM